MSSSVAIPFKTGLMEVIPGLKLNEANISAMKNNILRLIILITSVEFLEVFPLHMVH